VWETNVDRQGCGEVAVARPYEVHNHCQSATVGGPLTVRSVYTLLPQKFAAPNENKQIAFSFKL